MDQEKRVTVEEAPNSENVVRKTTVVTEAGHPTQHRRMVAARIVWYLGGLVLVLLGFRFVLALLGANHGNAFANGIFKITNPLVNPFYSLFGYTPKYGVAQLQVSVLVAMAVYALVAWGIVKLIFITSAQQQS